MKTNYGKIWVLTMTILITLAALPCLAVEKKGADIWAQDRPRHKHRQFELTDEAIKRIMNEIAETDPEEARELAKLREEKPVQFRKIMRERLAKEFREHIAGPGFGRRKGMMPGMMGPAGGGQGKMRKMLEKHAEYLEWLEKNYPDKAKELAELKDTNPQLCKRMVYLGLKKYGQIAKAEKENPELAKVLTEDLELKMERNELLRKIRSAADDDEKKELIEDLEKVISDRFDLIVKRKQMEYERLRKELKKLEKEVRKNEDEVEKWKDSEFKDENVKARLEELVSRADKFRWE